jgi:hypothetical protein
MLDGIIQVGGRYEPPRSITGVLIRTVRPSFSVRVTGLDVFSSFTAAILLPRAIASKAPY